MQKKPINKEGDSISSHWVAVGHEVHDRATKYDEQGVRIGDTPNRICLVEYPYEDGEGKDANARLIAAAPELLEALSALVNLHEGIANGGIGITNSDWDHARMVLSKAKGETE